MNLQDWLLGASRNRPTLKPYAFEDRSIPKRLLNLAALGAFSFFLFAYGFYFALTAPYLLVPMTAPLVLLAGLVIWALPELRTAPTKIMETLLFAFFIVLFLWPNYLAVSLPGLPWITLVRLTSFPMVLALLIATSVSKDFRAEMKRALSATPYIWIPLVTFVGIQVLTVPMSQNVMGSLQKLTVAQANWTAVFFASTYIFIRRGRVERWATLLWIIMLVVSAIALIEARESRVLWAGNIPSFLKVEDERVQGILSAAMRRATGQYRVKGMFTTPLGLAEFLALSIPFVLHFAFGPFRTGVRVAAALCIPVFLQVVISTDSRLGMVGCVMSILLYTLFWGVLRWRGDKRGLFGPTLVLAYPTMFCAIVGATFFVTRLRRMVWGGGAEQQSNAGRMTQIQDAIPKILGNPIGHGAGQGAETLGMRGAGGILTIDNYYLVIALEYGVIGFVVYYGLIVSAILYSGRNAFDPTSERELTFLVPICVTLTNFFIIKSVFSQQDNHPLIFMLLGMIVALVYRKRQAEAKLAA